jgi:hypothetical protein
LHSNILARRPRAANVPDGKQTNAPSSKKQQQIAKGGVRRGAFSIKSYNAVKFVQFCAQGQPYRKREPARYSARVLVAIKLEACRE